MEIKNIADILKIVLEEIDIDEYKPEIESNLKSIEKFLIKKKIIKVEESKEIEKIIKNDNNSDHLLKKSECERLDQHVTYLNFLKNKESLLKNID